MAFLKRKDAAEELGFSRQRLEKLIKQGRIVETAEGVDIEQARAVRAVMIDTVAAVMQPPAAARAVDAVDNPPPAKPATERRQYNIRRGADGSQGPDKTDPNAPLDFAAARTNRERANAALAELKYAEQVGRLIDVDEGAPQGIRSRPQDS
jgi:hypothetical protein